MISLTINGQTLEVPANSTVLEAAERAGITIPTLCHHKDLTPYGGCRLCVVEVQGARLPTTSCTMPVSRGMVVQTESPTLTRYRRAILELLLFNYYDASYTRSNGSVGLAQDTQFVYWANYYGIDVKSSMSKQPRCPVDSDPNPFVWVDMNKCILCTRCVRACAEIQGRFVWAQANRGYTTRIVAGADTTMLQARCESCGACVAYCPTGALDNKMSVSLGRPDKLVSTTCSYCGVGCRFNLNVKEDVPGRRVLRVTSDPQAPINGMHLCVKGRYGYDFIHASNRLLRPRVRKYLLDGTPRPKNRGPWVEVDWDTALKITTDGLRERREKYGPNSIGLLTSGKSLNEENFLMNKLGRQVLGTNNIDVCSHVYHSSTVDGLVACFGLGVQSNSLDDVVNFSRSALIIGSNTTEQHPVFGAKIRQAVLRWGLKLVVAHPDFINMSEYAALRIVNKPGTDVALINGLMHIILEKRWENEKFILRRTEGFKEFKTAIDPYTPGYVAEITGVPVETLYQAAEILATNDPMAVIWGVDLVQQPAARHAVMSLANLQMLLGNLGVPGGGVIPLRSQNNSQGACDMGGLPDYLPGYQPVDSPEARLKFEKAWGTILPDKAGLSAREMIASAGEGKLKALYILGEDLVAGAPDSPQLRRSLQACDLVILEEIFLSETSHYADVLLPGVSFAEKSGTFTNTERRIQLVNQAIQPLGEARPDWQILVELAQALSSSSAMREGRYAKWDYNSTSQIMEEVAELTPIYAGVSHARLEQVDRLQWPVESQDHAGTSILYGDGFPNGRGKFVPIPFEETSPV
jgi:predicted molibdopterin-dependent oxidoreductase YjgC